MISIDDAIFGTQERRASARCGDSMIRHQDMVQ